MWSVRVFSLVAVLLTVQGSYGGVEMSLSQLLAEMMQGSVNTGVCDGECYVEIGGTRHYFPDQFVDEDNDPCVEYRCDEGRVTKRRITCEDRPCPVANILYFPKECCRRCKGQGEPTPKITEWGPWARCSVTCGEGIRIRSRTCTVPDNAEDVGICEGVKLRESEKCTLTDCPVNCEWVIDRCDPCSATCGTATRKCYPRITVPASNGGKPCPRFVTNGDPQIQQCTDLPACGPEDCVWEYQNCGSCSATCGSGTRQCTPVITKSAKHGGKECPDFVRRGERQTLQCENLPSCPPEDCEWEYRNCGSCSATCGSATRQCTPVITKSEKHGGKKCPDFVRRGERQNLKCENLPTCPPEDCEWEYRNCGSCSATCGSATRQCTPVITKSAKHGGKECPDFVRRGERQTLQCENLPSCPPEDCEWEYRNCGSCSATCGSATRQCTPVITKSEKHGGKKCPDFVRRGERQNLKCENLPKCPPEDCEWEYRNCGSCSATCGSATRQCTPVITKSARHGGKDCPDFVRRGQHQTLKCEGLQPCPTTCNDDEHICVVRGVEVCVKNIVDPNKECKCILTYQNRIIDLDLDFIHNNCDNCRKVANGDQKDEDGDSVGDECDNCKTDKNRDQKDRDGDKMGDVCDPYNEVSPFQAQALKEDKKSMAAAIMEKLMEMYHSE